MDADIGRSIPPTQILSTVYLNFHKLYLTHHKKNKKKQDPDVTGYTKHFPPWNKARRNNLKMREKKREVSWSGSAESVTT